MGNTYKPKHKLLKEFTKILFKHNPMQLNLKGNPDAANEYESEALSILSRFTESALYLCDDVEMQREIASGIIKNTFEFWFQQSFLDQENVSLALLEAYNASYPVKQTNDSEVQSVS